MRMIERRGLLAAVVVAVIGLALALPAAGQIPDEFTNLQLLSEEIPKSELVATMRDWAGGLGVRCNYCHVGPDNLQGMDFATDEKPEKRTARRMLEMSRTINGELLAALPTVAEGGSHQVVSCLTCHRGLARPPRNLVFLLSGVYRTDGLEGALAEYRRLRKEHYAAGRYDFTAATLNRLAALLLEGGKPDEALAVLEANRDYFPESAELEAAFGFLFLQTGKPERARESFQRALAIDPDHPGAAFGLARLEAMAPEDPE